MRRPGPHAFCASITRRGGQGQAWMRQLAVMSKTVPAGVSGCVFGRRVLGWGSGEMQAAYHIGMEARHAYSTRLMQHGGRGGGAEPTRQAGQHLRLGAAA